MDSNNNCPPNLRVWFWIETAKSICNPWSPKLVTEANSIKEWVVRYDFPHLFSLKFSIAEGSSWLRGLERQFLSASILQVMRTKREDGDSNPGEDKCFIWVSILKFRSLVEIATLYICFIWVDTSAIIQINMFKVCLHINSSKKFRSQTSKLDHIVTVQHVIINNHELKIWTKKRPWK